jgi:hypothetical protein
MQMIMQPFSGCVEGNASPCALVREVYRRTPMKRQGKLWFGFVMSSARLTDVVRQVGETLVTYLRTVREFI